MLSDYMDRVGETERHVVGKVPKPDGYVYGGGKEPHGPYHYPKGCKVCWAGRFPRHLCRLHKY